MNDYNNQIGKIMKLKELMDIEPVIAKHATKLKALGEVEVNKLSISDMAFIKMVSSGSITSMRKLGASNEEILCTSQRRTSLNESMKVKSYLRNLPQDELMALLDSLKN